MVVDPGEERAAIEGLRSMARVLGDDRFQAAVRAGTRNDTPGGDSSDADVFVPEIGECLGEPGHQRDADRILHPLAQDWQFTSATRG